MTKVVITMPAYHAADTLERTVADIPVGIADELILVDILNMSCSGQS